MFLAMAPSSSTGPVRSNLLTYNTNKTVRCKIFVVCFVVLCQPISALLSISHVITVTQICFRALNGRDKGVMYKFPVLIQMKIERSMQLYC